MTTKIIVLRCPKIDSPDFTKDAFQCLELDADGRVGPRKNLPQYPHGAWTVPISNVLRALAVRDLRAYQYFRGDWLSMLYQQEKFGCTIQFFIPCEVCVSLDEVMH